LNNNTGEGEAKSIRNSGKTGYSAAAVNEGFILTRRPEDEYFSFCYLSVIMGQNYINCNGMPPAAAAEGRKGVSSSSG